MPGIGRVDEASERSGRALVVANGVDGSVDGRDSEASKIDGGDSLDARIIDQPVMSGRSSGVLSRSMWQAVFLPEMEDLVLDSAGEEESGESRAICHEHTSVADDPAHHRL